MTTTTTRHKRHFNTNHSYHGAVGVVLLILVLGANAVAAVTSKRISRIASTTTTTTRPAFMIHYHHHYPLQSNCQPTNLDLAAVLKISRGGAAEEDDEHEDEDYEEDEEEDEDEEDTTTTDLAVDQETVDEFVSLTSNMLRQTLNVVQKAVQFTVKALSRSVDAAFDEGEDEADLPTLSRVVKAAQRMLLAIVDFSTSNDKGEEDTNDNDVALADVDDDNDVNDGASSSGKSSSSLADYGVYLEKAYKIKSPTRNNSGKKPPCTIHSGSFSDALVTARSQARLLLVLIPSRKPSKPTATADAAALQAFLSNDVSNMANRKARKTQKTNTGSFLLWSALPGSPEATLALKRIKGVTTKLPSGANPKRPILAVAYVGHAVDAHGRSKVVPKLLAQHHATPPPTADMMAAWMNALRKRHAAQYVKMQKDLTELEYSKERKEGYQSSIQTDVEQERQRARDAAAAQARQEAERERREQLVRRREELRATLPEEPSTSESARVKTISFRLDNGTQQVRRFTGDTKLETVFNWIDVTFELERETTILVTLNGRHRYEWKDCLDDDSDNDDGSSKTLENLKLGKMIAFRVSQQQQQQDDNNEKESKDDEEEEEE